MSETQEYQDPDDIFRDIDLNEQDDIDEENIRLIKKRKGYRSNFTLSVNSINNLMTASRFDSGGVNRSQGNKEALLRARQKLETRYEKLQALNNRQLVITQDEEVEDVREAGFYQGNIDAAAERYNQIIRDLALLDEALQPQPHWNDNNHHNEHPNHSIKPIIALKPSFTLSFDNTPTELNTWSTQFRSYFDASRLETLPQAQQQAFLRQGLNPDVWTAIKHKINDDTPVFSNPLDLEEDSCQKLIENAFQIRYPLIMRRYKFFTYERRGNQTVTNFRAKLRELAAAAQLEQMGQNDYLIFRMIAGINDSHTTDKLLSIPQADFNLEEIERVALACEAAKNYTGLHHKSSNVANNVFQNKRPQQHKSNFRNPMLDTLAKEGKCFRCGRKFHEKGEACPHRSSKCNKCGVTGHISPVCANSSKSKSRPPSRFQSRNPSRSSSPVRNQTHLATGDSNITRHICDFSGPKPTPKQWMTFTNENNGSFGYKITPDSGATRTIFSKNILDEYGFKYGKNISKEKLFNASMKPMAVNGIVHLTANFNGRSKIINGLVTEDLHDIILISWYDAEELGSISIARNVTIEMPLKRIEDIKKKYSPILRNTLSDKPMEGPPMKIHFKKQAIANGIYPKKIYTASQTPLHQQTEASKVLKAALRDKIIEELPTNEPSEWCSRAFFVPKSNGSVRLVVDLSPLNEYIERPTHPFTAGMHLIKNLNPNSKVFCKLDAVLGYFQIPLDEESKKFTTFLLPSGRYRFLRAPMGLSASSDEWCKRSDEALYGIPGVHKLVDDILIEATDYDDLLEKLESVLERCLKSNITISLDKLQIGDSVIFAGYKVSAKSVHPIKERTEAIKNFPAPTNKTELKSFLGLANQVGIFVPDLVHATTPMRALLKKNAAWQWLPDHALSMQETKDILTGDLVLKTFDPNHVTELITDASRKGLGFILMQVDPSNGNRHLIQCGSRSLADPESRYAVCELEGLAILYAVNKCKHYLLGIQEFHIITDHKPLIGMWAKSLPDIANVRLQRYKEKLTAYNFKIEWREGKSNEIADALSRAPVFPAREEESRPDYNDVCYAITTLQKDPSDPQLNPMMEAAKADIDYQQIIEAITKTENPKLLPSNHPGRQLSSVWSQLSINDSLGLIIVDNQRIFVPKSQRQNILEKLHLAHCGTAKTTWRAKDLYYWRGMSTEIKLMVQNCEACRPFLPSQSQEPIIPGTTATGPMTDVGSDLFQIGHNHYLVMVDRYSGFPFVAKLKSLTSSSIIKILTDWFNTFGWPERIRTDNGPQYRSEFDEFCKQFNIIHENSSPYFAQSNGLSEAAVKQMKHLMKKVNENNNEFSTRLLEFKNTQNISGKSPAQMFFGRRLRSQLPHLPGANDLDIANAKIGAEQRKTNMQDTEKQPRTALPELTIGQKVLIQNPLSNVWDNKGKITSIRPNKRSYDVVFDNGKTYLRNRKFLRPINTTLPSATSTPDTLKLKNYWMAKYEEEFPPLKPALRRSTRIANKNSKVTFGKNTYS